MYTIGLILIKFAYIWQSLKPRCDAVIKIIISLSLQNNFTLYSVSDFPVKKIKMATVPMTTKSQLEEQQNENWMDPRILKVCLVIAIYYKIYFLLLFYDIYMQYLNIFSVGFINYKSIKMSISNFNLMI